ncbi:radical SAM/SPASM domain-containing protein [Selenomonas sp. FC4001]|uniref:radical SAM/SPASM domain-containing protein n=1 Tax=Selenomonas sp. FC4001 TaxID=1408313 RepID=UPI00056B613A|nr:radical SAM/SPASM domain-containing protein [Selenomonas sp. FC4001]
MKNIIFGAGRLGKKLYSILGGDVDYFVDNNIKLHNTEIFSTNIYPVNVLLDEKDGYLVWIAGMHVDDMEIQLLELGVKKYCVFTPRKKMFSNCNCLLEDYTTSEKVTNTEQSWNKKNDNKSMIKYINNNVDKIYKKDLLFRWVEIETINRCNGTCDFCPVSVGKDIRERKIMDYDLFQKIIDELYDLHYGGKLALFSNNEPFLDTNIIEKAKYARHKLPFAHLYTFTNGTVLTMDLLLNILPYLDELFIDNYTENYMLIPIVKELVEYEKKHPEIAQKVTVHLRDPHEILTSRGGIAPNRKSIISYPKEKCLLPFRQLIIRPDGKVSLCCNDALGKVTLGDLRNQSICEIWYGEKYKKIRECIYRGRENICLCKKCDTFYDF